MANERGTDVTKEIIQALESTLKDKYTRLKMTGGSGAEFDRMQIEISETEAKLRRFLGPQP